MANKTTKRDVINMMLNEVLVQENTLYKTYLEHELELLDRKAANKKPSKTQEKNEGVKAEILATLTGEGMTVTELMKASDVLGALSNQKISALLSQMVKAHEVVKASDKKRSLFSLPQ